MPLDFKEALECELIPEDEIRYKESVFEATGDESIFYDAPEQIEKESYYMANLCGFSAKLHKPYAEYLDRLEHKNNGEIF